MTGTTLSPARGNARYRDCRLRPYQVNQMSKLPITRPWTEADVERLKQLSEQGATLLRASAALRRNGSAVQKRARDLGLLFKGLRAVRAEMRDTEAIEHLHWPARR